MHPNLKLKTVIAFTLAVAAGLATLPTSAQDQPKDKKAKSKASAPGDSTPPASRTAPNAGPGRGSPFEPVPGHTPPAQADLKSRGGAPHENTASAADKAAAESSRKDKAATEHNPANAGHEAATGKPPADAARTTPRTESERKLPDSHGAPATAEKRDHAPEAGHGAPVHPALTQVKLPDGHVEKRAPSGQVRETTKVDRATGAEHTQQLTPSGRVDREVVRRPDGTQHTTQYALNGKVAREEVVHNDGSREVTTHQMGRDGNARVQETVKFDHGREVSKTVVVKNVTIVRNTTVINNTVVRNYDRGHFGFVYRPVYVVHSPVFVSWYDPYWYAPSGVVIFHPFHYAWGWEHYGWYHHYHGPYWTTYDVYPAPSYWVTDWLVAGYVADHYAAMASVAQAQEEARLAREDAEKARRAAELAADEAEIAEAKAAAAQAELRARNAEERAARAQREEASAGKPNPNATPIDQDTKEALKNQIEQTIAEKKQLADQSDKEGRQLLPDLSRTLADPKHIYPVSKTTSVISAKDSSPAGTLSEGDLLKLEPGQEGTLKDANETTFVSMRVMTSKGEEGEVTAGALVSIPLKDLQEFDNEFRAKLDLGLQEADKNKDQFKQAAAL